MLPVLYALLCCQVVSNMLFFKNIVRKIEFVTIILFIRASAQNLFYLKLKLLVGDVVPVQRVHLTANSVTHLGLATDVGRDLHLTQPLNNVMVSDLHCLNIKFTCSACVCLYVELNCY
jgi:hypothetical protein